MRCSATGAAGCDTCARARRGMLPVLLVWCRARFPSSLSIHLLALHLNLCCASHQMRRALGPELSARCGEQQLNQFLRATSGHPAQARHQLPAHASPLTCFRKVARYTVTPASPGRSQQCCATQLCTMARGVAAGGSWGRARRLADQAGGIVGYTLLAAHGSTQVHRLPRAVTGCSLAGSAAVARGQQAAQLQHVGQPRVADSSGPTKSSGGVVSQRLSAASVSSLPQGAARSPGGRLASRRGAQPGRAGGRAGGLAGSGDEALRPGRRRSGCGTRWRGARERRTRPSGECARRARGMRARTTCTPWATTAAGARCCTAAWRWHATAASRTTSVTWWPPSSRHGHCTYCHAAAGRAPGSTPRRSRSVRRA